jgi:iturin family lipopeptide synthetase B/iturin family lipopeptide synthetase C
MSKKAKIQDIYPLAPMQEGMLFHYLNRDTASAYFEQTSYRLHGQLDVGIVKKSLDELMRRHDILRTAFVHEGVKRPMQVVLQDRTCDFFFEDISRLADDTAKDAAVRDIIEKDRQRSFDLKKDVLLRVTVIKTAPDVHEFIWSHPHIIMDGWCLGIVISEYLEIYRTLIRGKPLLLPEAVPFKKYIEWLENRDMQESLNYWTGYLQGYHSRAVIPRIKSAGAGKKGFEKKIISVALGEAETARLDRLVKTHHTTMSNLVLTAWGIVLSRYKGEPDVVFGRVVSGRPPEIAGVETILGLFINTVPVRVRVENEITFSDLLAKIREEMIGNEPHHYCPLVKINACSPLKRDLFDHIISFQNYPVAEQAAGAVNPGSAGERKALFEVSDTMRYEHTNYDFILLAAVAGNLTVNLEYNARVYEDELVEKIAGHLRDVLKQDLENEEIESLRSLHKNKHKKMELLESFNEDLEDE